MISYRPRHFGPEHIVFNILNSQGLSISTQGPVCDIIADSPAIDLGMSTDDTEQVVRFTNLGHGPADILGLQSAPSFAITDSDCGDELAAGQSCTAAVRFEPTGYGRRDETITLLTGADAVPVRVLGGLMTPHLTVEFAAPSIKLLELTRLRLTFVNTTAQALFIVDVARRAGSGRWAAEFTPACGSPR
jgi:hypothetical protein